jgi:broad specificity phosphatase PhoE
MLLILARHGNTFNGDEKVYRVGNVQDLPLVEKGLEQAQCFVTALLEKNIKPAAVYCGPLQRTRKFAEIIVAQLDLLNSSIVDSRLDELSYGAWAGLGDDEIKNKFGMELDLWEKHGRWPRDSKWPETEKGVVQQVRAFAKELAEKYNPEDVVIAVSSNGKIRYFLKLVENEFEDRLKSGNIKVGTGNVCVIAFDGGKFELVAWNINPAEL